jgi:hypothetical protein
MIVLMPAMLGRETFPQLCVDGGYARRRVLSVDRSEEIARLWCWCCCGHCLAACREVGRRGWAVLGAPRAA